MLTAVESERAVLAAIIYDRHALPLVAPRLKPYHFSDPAYEAIYAAACDLYDEGKPADLTTLAETLRKRDQLGLAPVSLLGSLQGDLATADILHLDTYCDEIIEAWTRKETMRAASEAMREGSDPGVPSATIISNLETKLLALTVGKYRKSAVTLGEALVDAFTAIETASKAGGIQGVATGFCDLDDLLGGLRGGQLVVLAARPGVGKSSMATCIAANAALSQDKGVTIFSLEMNAREVASRMLSQQSRVEGHKISRGKVWDTEWPLLVQTGGTLGPSRILIDDSTLLTPTALRAKASAAKVRGYGDLLIVDYLGLMRGDRKYESRNVEIGEISGSLLALAKDLDVPVLALSQLNRATERDERRPELHDLRDSGSLEQDAHIVMFLYRSKEDVGKPTEVLVKKNRAGRIGTVLLEWNPSITRFEDYKEVYVAGPVARWRCADARRPLSLRRTGDNGRRA